MNHSIKLTDSFSFPAEAVRVEPKKTIGTTNPINLTKAIFKVPNGQYNDFVAVDFMGEHADLPRNVKPGKKYLLTVVYRGRAKDDKVYMSFQGIMLGEL